ncbi:hypothetical protein BDP27DRAFT_1319230, partial [Rhodocollybia butyracea]
MRKSLIVVLWGVVKAFAGLLDLTITPTVTIGQTAEASWKWNFFQIPLATHTFVVVLDQGESHKSTFTTVQTGFSGVIPLTVPNTGSMPSSAASSSLTASLPPSATSSSGALSSSSAAIPSPMLLTPSSAQTITQVTTTTAPASTQTSLAVHHSLSPGILACFIVGGLLAFLLLALSAICIWRRVSFYPAVTIPGESSVAKSYWDGDSDLYSLTPSDSVSRAMHSFPRK